MAKNNKQLNKVYEERSQNNPLLTLQQEQRLYQLHEEKNIGVFDQYKSCKNVVVFGNPRCGKSTVINSLLGHQLKSIPHPKGEGYFRIDLANSIYESKIKIFHKSQAEQQELTSASTKDITVWECPGLYKNAEIDRTDDKIKMVESPRIMQLLKTLDSIKFIFVVDYCQFNYFRGQGFSWTANVIASIFSNIDIIEKSILLVVTRAPKNIDKKSIIDEIDKCRVHEISENTQKMLQYFNESSIYIFSKPTQEGEIKGLTLEDMASLSFCDVTQAIQYPRLNYANQELALERLAEDDARIQREEEEKAREELEKAEINTQNISNAWFFIKVVDFLYDILSSMSILSKAGQYAGGVLMAFSSLIDINKFKSYFSSNKMEAVSAKDYSPQPMSPEKAKLAKCLVKILNDNEDLSKEFNQKFNECIEQYTNCKNDEEKQSIVKQFSEWIISETNLKNELRDFEEGYNSSESDSSDTESASSDDDGGNDQSEEEAFRDKTLNALYEELPNLVSGGGDNLASDDKNPAAEQQEDNTTDVDREGDGYDAGVALGGRVNNSFDTT